MCGLEPDRGGAARRCTRCPRGSRRTARHHQSSTHGPPPARDGRRRMCMRRRSSWRERIRVATTRRRLSDPAVVQCRYTGGESRRPGCHPADRRKRAQAVIASLDRAADFAPEGWEDADLAAAQFHGRIASCQRRQSKRDPDRKTCLHRPRRRGCDCARRIAATVSAHAELLQPAAHLDGTKPQARLWLATLTRHTSRPCKPNTRSRTTIGRLNDVCVFCEPPGCNTPCLAW